MAVKRESTAGNETAGVEPNERTSVDVCTRYCVNSAGDDVQILVEGEEEESPGGGETPTEEEPDGENCHFHAGVEYVVSLPFGNGRRGADTLADTAWAQEERKAAL